MEFNDKDFQKIAVLIIILILGVLVFLAIRPIFLSVIGGLLLAYLTMPLFKRVLRVVRNRTLAASIVSLIIIIIIVVPLWFILPIIIQQIFEILKTSQSFDVQGFLKLLFPNSSEQFISQISNTISSGISQIGSSTLDYIVGGFLKLPTILLNLFIVAFVFFFTLRDSNYLKQFATAISPINRTKQTVLVEKFRAVTDSIIYGQVIVGLVQGIAAGLGFLIFGVDNALVLTILAVILSIIPFIGPAVVWVPVAIFMFASGQSHWIAILFLLYNVLFVSTVDNLVRAYIVSKRAKLSPVFVFVGMIGGVFIFGILGLVLGPLIIAYFILLLNSYKEKTLSELFTMEEQHPVAK